MHGEVYLHDSDECCVQIVSLRLPRAQDGLVWPGIVKMGCIGREDGVAWQIFL